MLSPRYQKQADRLRELISDGVEVAKLDVPSRIDPRTSYIQDKGPLREWLVKMDNILETTFGKHSAHYRHYAKLTATSVESASQVGAIVGVLKAALSDLEGGFLTGQEHLIAADIFDTILEQAKHLNESGYKDPAAVLMRVVLEDALKRLARENSIDDSKPAVFLNEELKKAGVYPQQQWRLIQARIDIGNAAAHGKFSEYTDIDVSGAIDDVERLLAAYFCN